MDKGSWTLEGALPVIRRIAAIAEEHGFAVSLYGSVLEKGHSNSDLDLYFVVAEAMTTPVHAQTCIAAIVKALPEIEAFPQLPGTYRIQFRDGRRIDAQFLAYAPLH